MGRPPIFIRPDSLAKVERASTTRAVSPRYRDTLLAINTARSIASKNFVQLVNNVPSFLLLRELGYIEGKNIIIEWRAADGKRDRQDALAGELVRLKVDVIVAARGEDTRAAKGATATIPIVMAQTDDPVGNGFVASLARPGGNITGLSTVEPELSGKRLELLKEVVPKLSRVAVIEASTILRNDDVGSLR